MSHSRGLLLVLAALTISCAATGPSDTVVLSQAKLLLDDAPVPPGDGDPRWRSVELTDSWRTERPHYGGFAWYRFALPSPSQTHGPWGVYLPTLDMNAAVFVNGELVGSGGRFDEPVARNSNRPFYFSFPLSLLDADRNQLHVRLFAYADHHGKLGPVRVGPDTALRPVYEDRRS